MISNRLLLVARAPVRRFIAKPLIVAVLMHAVLGCCLHHVDACAPPADSASPTVPVACHCDHETDGHGPCEKPNDHDSQHGCCSGDRCVSTRPEKIASATRLLSCSALVALPAVAVRPPCEAGASIDPWHRPGGPPVAVYLLNRALLL